MGPIDTYQAVKGNMEEGSKIAIMTSPVGPRDTNHPHDVYRMAKVGVVALGMQMAEDLKKRGIPVALLYPGLVLTDETLRFYGWDGVPNPEETHAPAYIKIIEEQLTMETTGTYWAHTGTIMQNATPLWPRNNADEKPAAAMGVVKAKAGAKPKTKAAASAKGKKKAHSSDNDDNEETGEEQVEAAPPPAKRPKKAAAATAAKSKGAAARSKEVAAKSKAAAVKSKAPAVKSKETASTRGGKKKGNAESREEEEDGRGDEREDPMSAT